ncbi:hypothetical protein TIFTF001_032297 [Ficus carica]|uniref:Uncharacterized protein n=1 Tax=Ficus carica TaxID=3494 RepID=A0AA88DWT4_FICCA|nr:hypothetical protein TIFTF001_032297 [Ficus carica]
MVDWSPIPAALLAPSSATKAAADPATKAAAIPATKTLDSSLVSPPYSRPFWPILSTKIFVPKAGPLARNGSPKFFPIFLACFPHKTEHPKLNSLLILVKISSLSLLSKSGFALKEIGKNLVAFF